MKRTPISPDISLFPSQYRTLLQNAPLYDSSCSPEARVYYIDAHGGFYLKTAAKGSLETESKLTAFFHSKGLSAQVLDYASLEQDWLLTRRLPGEDCIHRQYLDDPQRLCDTTATLLRQLHGLSVEGCPVQDRNESYRATALRNYATQHYDTSLFPDNWGYSSAEEAWQEIEKNGSYLQQEVLLHGDYCLPNILLDNWQFSGFIDLGNGGIGDRHIDLFWGVWTLFFNLKTNRYYHRFLDAYGRELVQPEKLRTIAAFEVFG